MQIGGETTKTKWIEWRWRRCVLGEGDSHLNKYLKCLIDVYKRYNVMLMYNPSCIELNSITFEWHKKSRN